MSAGAGLRRRRAAIAAAVVLVASCQRDVFIGADKSRDGVHGDSGTGGTGAGGTGAGGTGAGGVGPDAAPPCQQVECEGQLLACGNCLDDDGDGKKDGDDPDCLGPCHQTEDNFSNPHPGPEKCVQDCYFDGNAGLDDGCIWSHECDQLAKPPDFPPGGESCAYNENANLPRQATCASVRLAQSADCGSKCLPITPNGCDCFGCCEVQGRFVYLGSTDDKNAATCDLEHVTDPALCKPCTQVPSCSNDCKPCERCIGKTELPAGCNPEGECPAPKCDRGASCGLPCLPPCPGGQWCITGCCVDAPR
jgi:hypothetical protein